MERSIVVSNRFSTALIDTKELLYIEHYNRKVSFHTSEFTIWEYCSMQSASMRINDEHFFLCHSYLIVNICAIVSIRDNKLYLRNGEYLMMCKSAMLKTKKAWKDWINLLEINKRNERIRRVMSQMRL